MDRSRFYKNKDKDADELRRRRADQSLELRKAKKEEQLQKRRNINLELDETSPLKERQVENFESLDLEKLISDMKSSDPGTVFHSVQTCRMALSRAKNPPIDKLCKAGVIEILIKFLNSPIDNLVFEATWALTNIASGDSSHTLAVVNSGTVPMLISLLNHSAVNVAEQSVWALGNIAGDCANLRDAVIKAGVLEPVLNFMEKSWKMPNVMGNITWMLSNLCRNRDRSPPKQVVMRLLPIFKRLLQYDQCSGVIRDAAWSISYISDTINGFINDILNSGCLPYLLQLLASSSTDIVTPCLRAVGNLVTGDDQQTQVVLDNGILKYIPILLQNHRSNVVTDTCWIISNISAGTTSQIQMIIDNNIIPLVIHVLNSGEHRSKREACWVINNICSLGSVEQCIYLLNQQIIRGLAGMLKISDNNMILLALQSYNKLFEVSDSTGELEAACVEFETCGALDDLEKLQDSDDDKIYKCAYDMVEKYFCDKVDESQTSANDSTHAGDNNNEFQFIPPENISSSTNFTF